MDLNLILKCDASRMTVLQVVMIICNGFRQSQNVGDSLQESFQKLSMLL
jgi:hypothetical protein